jgi:hypothetical protein
MTSVGQAPAMGIRHTAAAEAPATNTGPRAAATTARTRRTWRSRGVAISHAARLTYAPRRRQTRRPRPTSREIEPGSSTSEPIRSTRIRPSRSNASCCMPSGWPGRREDHLFDQAESQPPVASPVLRSRPSRLRAGISCQGGAMPPPLSDISARGRSAAVEGVSRGSWEPRRPFARRGGAIP